MGGEFAGAPSLSRQKGGVRGGWSAKSLGREDGLIKEGGAGMSLQILTRAWKERAGYGGGGTRCRRRKGFNQRVGRQKKGGVGLQEAVRTYKNKKEGQRG